MRFLGLAIGIVVCLIAASAALWPGFLSLPGFAQTTDIEASWTAQTCSEFHTWPALPAGSADLGEFEGKDVGSVSVTGVGTHTLALSLANSYPSNAVQCAFSWINSGTLVARADTIALAPVSGLTGCTISSNLLDCAQLTVSFTAPAAACLPPGEEQTLNLISHTEQPASEGGTMQFNLQMQVVQCEEPVTPVPTPILVTQVAAVTVVPTGTPVATATLFAEVAGVEKLPPTGLGFDQDNNSDRTASIALFLLGSSLILVSLWAIRRAAGAGEPNDTGQGGGEARS